MKKQFNFTAVLIALLSTTLLASCGDKEDKISIESTDKLVGTWKKDGGLLKITLERVPDSKTRLLERLRSGGDPMYYVVEGKNAYITESDNKTKQSDKIIYILNDDNSMSRKDPIFDTLIKFIKVQ